MKANTLDIRPVSGAIGAEIAGVDLAHELSDETVAEIRRAWLERLVVFFRDQTLPPAEFLAWRERFGERSNIPSSRASTAFRRSRR